MNLYEVVEIATGARMSRTPKVGDFREVNRKGEIVRFTPGDLIGTTVFESPEHASAWRQKQGLSLLEYDVKLAL